ISHQKLITGAVVPLSETVAVAPWGILLTVTLILLPSRSFAGMEKDRSGVLAHTLMIFSLTPPPMIVAGSTSPVGGLLLQLFSTIKVISLMLLPTSTPFLYSSTLFTTSDICS